MTERRDPPADADAERPGERPSRRVASVRALPAGPSRRKLAIAALIVSALIGLAWGAVRLAGSAGEWLHVQPEYHLAFDQIELAPPPPAEFKSGAKGLLAQVRKRANLPETLRLLDLDLDDFGLAFAKHSPWVERVERVERLYPRRLIVHLRYRRPVARVEGLAMGSFQAVAQDGVLLPHDDLSEGFGSQLVWLVGIPGAREVLPGHFLGLDASGQPRPDVTAALALARFFRGRAEEGRIWGIAVAGDRRSLTVFTQRKFRVAWGRALGTESVEELGPAEKLQILISYEDANPDMKPEEKSWLVFRGRSLVYVPPPR